MSHDPPHGGPNLGEVPVETFSSVDYSYSGSDVAFFFIFAVFTKNQSLVSLLT